LLSCLIGKEGVRRLVLRVAPWVDTGMGVLLCGLALQLFISEIA
jgi:threonine/homoserine/homoserine lactone efflux protein